jgi:hypothetical protein
VTKVKEKVITEKTLTAKENRNFRRKAKELPFGFYFLTSDRSCLSTDLFGGAFLSCISFLCALRVFV